MGINIFDIANTIIGIGCAIAPLVQVALGVKAQNVREQQQRQYKKPHYISRNDFRRR